MGMNHLKAIFFLITGAVLAPVFFVIAGEKPHMQCTLVIQFENVVGNELLKLDTVQYKNELGQSYTVSRFRYYISNVVLENNKGKECHAGGYFLVDADEKNSGRIVMEDIPPGEYHSIRFTLGVDSLHNCSGAQSGALDPANGMFWAWNTGYIFLKMEGKSPVSKSPRNILEFHIGGYRNPVNCIRTISLPFKSNLSVVPGKESLIRVRTDVAELFKAPVSIDFSELSSVTDFHYAVTIADNYVDMFSLVDIKQ